MKISYLGNFNEKKVEGLMIILSGLKKYFSKNNTLSVNNSPEMQNPDIINIHASGFYEAVKHRKLRQPKIYSLHANIKLNPLMSLYDYLQYYFFIYSRELDHLSFLDRVTKTFMGLASYSTPLFVKKYFFNKMDMVILPNTWLSKQLKLKNSTIIHHGIDIRKFRKKVAKKTGKIVVSYFGHPTPDKGLLEAIAAFSKLSPEQFDKRLFLTAVSKRIVNFIKRKDSSIKISGVVKNIVDEYNKSDIIILPYRHSAGAIATPLVLLETMACEKAVVTTNLPHLKEICKDSVAYVMQYSAKGIVNAVSNLAEHPEQRKMLGKKARQRVVEFYNQETMFKEYENLYGKIAEGKH